MIRAVWKILGFGTAWDLLWSLRAFTLVIAIFGCLLGVVLVSNKAPWFLWIAVPLVVAVEVKNSLRWRRSTSHGKAKLVTSEESQGEVKPGIPAWVDYARCYYSEVVDENLGDPVSVFDVSDIDELSSDSPGTLCLRLEPQFPSLTRMQVLDAAGREQGIIRSLGLVPGVRYAMRRNGKLVWKLTVRSILRKRHTLELANGDLWTFDTPFYWWQNLTGTAFGSPRLLGGLIVPAKNIWGMWIEPGSDTLDLLAAVAYMHRQYLHW